MTGKDLAERPAKAPNEDFHGRFREIISDPLNLLIERVPMAGMLGEDGKVTLHNGIRVPVSGAGAYYGNFSDILVLNRGVHEPLEEYVFQQLVKRLGTAPVMLELGAYWAHYSMWLLLVRPEGRAFMVEPLEENLRAGAANFAAHGMNGGFIHAAVGPGQFEVDRFMAQLSLAKLDILHADIQGADVLMLVASERTLVERKVDYVFVSTHTQDLHNQVASMLTVAGYRIEVSSDPDFETTSNDGLVFASSPKVPAVFTDFSPLGRVEIASASPQALIASLSGQLSG